MMFSFLEITQHAGVATVWMNRPELHNAFNAQLIHELYTAFQQLDGDADVRAVVLAARGKSFSAGADLNWMKSAVNASQQDNHNDALALSNMLHTLATLRKPTIARVQGAAIGGGMGLVSACDICVAADTAKFATSEVKLGLIPSVISPYVIRAIGPRQAHRYFLTAEMIPATTALAIGLAHEVVPADQLDDKINTLLAALQAGGPEAQAASKVLIQSVSYRPIDQSLLELCARNIAELRTGSEAQEGMAAFLARRAPQWLHSKES
ncbi:enoyl-CoA hydratase/isomerase family protein [Paenalcaligenes sp. Me131]|uniref:enoyl-CoA hydratase/isomerase family protein n=1 Tax=Paenalcaligenes sp. Me131 TaxID=3392636 RepID=UPI003D2ACCEC